MSRIGKRPIPIPEGVKVGVVDGVVEVQGKGGKLLRSLVSSVEVRVENGQVVVENRDSSKKNLYGLTRTLIANMVEGVSKGFTKELELKGVGYRAQLKGNSLVLQLGYSQPVEYVLPEGISAKVEGQTKIEIRGADKEKVGLVADQIRRLRPPEPYKGKGIRYVGEVVRLKQGKTAGK